jgi:hypothetical protein
LVKELVGGIAIFAKAFLVLAGLKNRGKSVEKYGAE